MPSKSLQVNLKDGNDILYKFTEIKPDRLYIHYQKEGVIYTEVFSTETVPITAGEIENMLFYYLQAKAKIPTFNPRTMKELIDTYVQETTKGE